MKVGIYSPYFDVFGGGEHYILTVAEYFQNRGDDVTIFSPRKIDASFLGIALDRVRFVSWPTNIIDTAIYDLIFFLSDGSIPTLLSSKNILHFQTPFNYSNQKTFLNKLKLLRINATVCNSAFTKKFVDQTYGINSQVLYPPVDIENFTSGKKENLIFSVGRFFIQPHNKKHEEMIKLFKKLVEDGLKGWKLVMLGGIAPEHEKDLPALKKLTLGYPIEVITNGGFEDLKKYYSRAKIFWHAAGFGEDLEASPEKAEHFGISTVEAMAAGCVPIVFKGGGQIEIVTNGENGFLWESEEEWKDKTLQLIIDQKLGEKLALNAKIKAGQFSKEKFFTHLEKICVF